MLKGLHFPRSLNLLKYGSIWYIKKTPWIQNISEKSKIYLNIEYITLQIYFIFVNYFSSLNLQKCGSIWCYWVLPVSHCGQMLAVVLNSRAMLKANATGWW